MVNMQPRATTKNKAECDVFIHGAGPTPLFPVEDNDRGSKRPVQGTRRGQDDVIRLADAAGRNRENAPSSGRIADDNDSGSDSERIITVLRTDSSISEKGDAAGSRRTSGGRVQESPLLRKKRVRYVRFLSRSIVAGAFVTHNVSQSKTTTTMRGFLVPYEANFWCSGGICFAMNGWSRPFHFVALREIEVVGAVVFWCAENQVLYQLKIPAMIYVLSWQNVRQRRASGLGKDAAAPWDASAHSLSTLSKPLTKVIEVAKLGLL